MSYFSVAPTLCEVTYDSDLNSEERQTPYRYQCRSAIGRYSNGTHTHSASPVETGNLSLPSGLSVSYYEYLRTLYDSKICNSPRNQGHHGHSPGSISARNHYPPGGNGLTIPQGIVVERRPHTANSYIHNDHSTAPTSICLPSIQQGWGSSHDDEDEVGSGEGSRTSENRLKWIDALNKWIPEQNQTRPYLSFVGNAPVVEKLLREAQKNKENDANKANGKCERFEQHMHCHDNNAKNRYNSQYPENSFAYRLMTLKRREALRQKANESLEQNKQRKAYSSPLYDRRLKVRFQTPSAPSRPRATPTVEREPITLPKDISWDGDKADSESSSRLCESSERDASPVKSIEEVVEEEPVEEIPDKEASVSDSTMEDDKSNIEEGSIKSVKSPPLLPPVISETPIIEEESESEVEEPKEKESKTEVVEESTEIFTPITDDESDVEYIPPQKSKGKKELKKLKKSSSSKLTAAKVKSSVSLSQSKSNKSTDKLVGKSSSKKIKPVKDAPETDFDIEEVATVIPTVGDCKTGPLSLQSGRASAKKTREEVKLPSDINVPISRTSPETPRKEEIKFPPVPVPIPTPRETSEKEEVKVPMPEIVPTPHAISPCPSPLTSDVMKRELHVKQKVSADLVNARRRQALFAKKTEKKQPPKPRTPTPPPRTPSPRVEEEPEPVPEETEPQTEIEIPKPQFKLDEPALPDPDSFRKATSPKKDRRTSLVPPLTKLQQKLKRKPFKRDTSYEDELRRLELAEKRRQKQMEMLDKLKSRKQHLGAEGMDMSGIPNFEDYGFLAKYCIFNRSNIEMFKHTFDIVDVDNKGWLQGIDVMIALRGINNKLTLQEEEYLYRIMELTGYNISKGADFKLFSVLAALSLRISALDDWMKNLIGSMDFKTLEMKMFMCKTLWECNVDKDTNKISLDQLCVELRAGGVSLKHEIEVRQKLNHLLSLDLLDFLTYIPLFIMIHQSVVDNPLNDVRDK